MGFVKVFRQPEYQSITAYANVALMVKLAEMGGYD